MTNIQINKPVAKPICRDAVTAGWKLYRRTALGLAFTGYKWR